MSEEKLLPQKLTNDSKATNFNRRILKRLPSAFDRNPEVDLLSAFPLGYSNRLQSRIQEGEEKGQEPCGHAELREPKKREEDIRSLLDPACPTDTVYPLSPSIKDIMGLSEQDSDKKVPSQRVLNLLSKCEVIQKGSFPLVRTIFKCSPTAVVKVVKDADDYTEYTTLQFLDKHGFEIPAPKPLGVLRVGQLSLIFTSYMPGKTLEETWPQMMIDQKLSIMDQLENIPQT